MKKLILLFAMIFGMASVWAQPTRMVLFEEFTQASCGPCASQNPAFNTLLGSNTTKAVAIKYQTSWPGVDPMNAANPSDVATRVTYYGVSGVPWAAMDGVAPTGSAYAGAPANVSQNTIDTRYAVTPALAISVTHSLNSTYDSIQIAVNVNNPTTSAFTPNGTFKLHTVIVEEEINYPSAPGSNGETDFYDVMRKMLPDANGTTLATSWAAGSSQTFTFNVALPTYIANLGEVAVVAFLQEDGNKNVVNAAYSAPQSVSGLADAGVSSVNASTNGLCDANLTPSVTIENAGTVAITSANVSYTLNGGTPVTQAWTGNLTAGQTATVTFPQTTLSGGTNEFIATVSNPNGSGDYNGMNNSSSPTLISILSATPQAAPKNEDFESATVGELPADMIFTYNTASAPLVMVLDKAAVNATWELGAYEQSAKSTIIDFYSMAAGEEAVLTTQKINVSQLSTPKLFFTHAYCQYTSENDALKVEASTDCGQTWTQLFNESGTTLATKGAQTSRLFPQAADWRTNMVSLSQFASSSEVVFRFTATSAYGNSLWLDNIWVSNNALDLDEEHVAASLSTYPNPASDRATIAFNVETESQVGVQLFNITGQMVINIETEDFAAGEHAIELNVADLPTGMYTAQVSINDEIRSLRISVAH